MLYIINYAIIITLFLSTCIMILISSLNKTPKTIYTEKKYYIMKFPEFIVFIGAITIAMSILAMLMFTFTSETMPHPIFYVVFGGFYYLGLFLIFKTINYKIIVKETEIIVFSTFKKPYSFIYSDIESVIRQTKQRYSGPPAERLVIKIYSGKKVIVEHSVSSYKKFYQLIKTKVANDKLIGF